MHDFWVSNYCDELLNMLWAHTSELIVQRCYGSSQNDRLAEINLHSLVPGIGIVDYREFDTLCCLFRRQVGGLISVHWAIV